MVVVILTSCTAFAAVVTQYFYRQETKTLFIYCRLIALFLRLGHMGGMHKGLETLQVVAEHFLDILILQFAFRIKGILRTRYQQRAAAVQGHTQHFQRR